MTRQTVIRQLNDQLRQQGLGGRVMMTSGVASLPATVVGQIAADVRAFDDFTADNDPYAEHDFGRIEVAGFNVMWKIDYYDTTLSLASPDPADASVTGRVMTIMLADEY